MTDPGASVGAGGAAFPLLRLRRTGALLDLPWELPLAQWPASVGFRELPVGPSRHLVRFLDLEGSLPKALAAGMPGGIDEPTTLVRRLNRWHEFF